MSEHDQNMSVAAGHQLIAGLQQELAELGEQHLLRRRRTVDSVKGATLKAEGRDLLAFCSNDYLGLASHPALVHAVQEGAARYGAGSGASHLISGHSRAHMALEEKLADWMQPCIEQPRALYFCTGYMANQAMISALAGKDAAVFSEQLNHASIIDGIRLSRAETHIYPHGDLTQLEQLLKNCTRRKKLVVTDSVFSMDGDLANIPALLALCERYGAWLLVDDAHGFGVLGEHGRGVLEHFALKSPNIVYMGTLGKAAGVGGAFVAAHESVIEYLIQKARAYIYTTAAAPALAHALLTSIDLISGEEGQQRRSHLRSLIRLFSNGLELRDWQLMPSETAVQPVLIGDNAATMNAAADLLKQGYWVGAIRPPTVPPGTARLRVTLSAAHQTNDVHMLVQSINRMNQMAYIAQCFAGVA